MDMEYVDKLAKDKNGVKYLLVGQDLFDWTIDAKGQKMPRKWCVLFWLLLQKKNRPQKFELTREQKLLESLIDYAKLKDLLYNEWEKVCVCWTYNTTPEKHILSLYGRQWIQVHSQIESIRYNTKF